MDDRSYLVIFLAILAFTALIIATVFVLWLLGDISLFSPVIL